MQLNRSATGDVAPSHVTDGRLRHSTSHRKPLRQSRSPRSTSQSANELTLRVEPGVVISLSKGTRHRACFNKGQERSRQHANRDERHPNLQCRQPAGLSGAILRGARPTTTMPYCARPKNELIAILKLDDENCRRPLWQSPSPRSKTVRESKHLKRRMASGPCGSSRQR